MCKYSMGAFAACDAPANNVATGCGNFAGAAEVATSWIWHLQKIHFNSTVQSRTAFRLAIKGVPSNERGDVFTIRRYRIGHPPVCFLLRKSMYDHKYLQLFLATVLPLSFIGVALAQSAASVTPPAASPYQLSGTSISGASQSNPAILTAPVNPDQAAYKTESGIYLYPTVFVAVGQNDNLLATDANRLSSNFFKLTPQVVAELKNKGDRYTALASFDATRYSSSSQDNTTNSEFKVAGDNYFTSRARVAWSVGRLNTTDARGSTDRSLSTVPDRWHANALAGRAIYGAPEAAGRVEMDLGYRDKAYDSNRNTTAGGDNILKSFAGRGLYRVGTRTMALAEYRQDKADYSLDNSGSSIERRYYAGLTWEATAATTGIVKVGRMTKDFDLDGKPSYSGSSWEATVRWTPLSYSVFDLSTNRSTADSTGVGVYILNTGTNLNWSHSWSQSLASRAGLGILDSDFAGTDRSDRVKTYSLGVDYTLLRWLKIGADFTRTDKSSTDATTAYKRNIAMFTLNASL
ncbi:MAG: outer membrane beta-barrel protein [Rhodoferax sp.]